MSHRLSVALGDRRSVALARSPLADAIQACLKGVPERRLAVRRTAPLLASALALSLAPALAQSAVITVDSGAGVATADGLCQLPEAVANANGGAVEADCDAGDAGLDSIVFDPALADSTISLAATLVVNEPLEIDGAAAPELLIAGTGGFGLISAQSDLAVSNLALAGGDAGSSEGGAIFAVNALSVDNVTFLGNHAKYGGAIDANGPLEVTNSYFAGNEANKYLPEGFYVGSGGAISSSQRPTITGSTFVQNSANAGGGAVHAPQGATITGSTFEDNEARVGGAVLSGNAAMLLGPPAPEPQGVPLPGGVDLQIADSTFSGNSAYRLDEPSEYAGPAMGGAVLFIPQSSGDGSGAHALTVTGSEFIGNVAASAAAGGPGGKYDPSASTGGALAAMLVAGSNEPRDPTAVTIDDSVFDDNLAAFGGAAFVSTSSITVEDSVFSSNQALIAGAASLGAKYDKYEQATSVALSGTTFNDNAAYVIGGAAVFGMTVQADGLTVTDNVAGVPTGTDPYSPQFDCESGQGKYGGAVIYAETATLTGANLVDGNCAGYGGGLAVSALSGSIAPGTVVSNNQAIAVDGFGGGLLVRSDAMLLDGLTISGNSSGGAGGGLFAYGAVTLANSTVSGNAGGTGAGIYAGDPDIQQAKGAAPGQVTLLNTTIHGNTATAPAIVTKGTVATVPGTGGGIAIGSGVQLDARFATITDNSASDAGGGIWLDPAATASLSDSIVAGNTAPLGPDIAGTISAQYTLVQDPAGATFSGAGTGNQTGLDPDLGPLQDNGGVTETRLPLPGSPVIDSGDPGFATPPEFDQRGPGFPRIVNGVVDKGAVELALQVPQVISLAIDPSTVLEGSGASITVGLDGSAPADVYVTLDLAGQATAGLDYTITDADPLTTGVQVLVAAGDSEGSVALQALLDGVSEPDESVTATVADVVGADLPAPLSATGTIVDGDGVPMVSLSLGQGTILEEGGSTTLTVTLSVPSTEDVTVTLGFSGTATFGTDYTVGGTQIVIPAGQTSGSVVLSAIDDADDEGDETVVVDILSVVNAQAAANQQGTILIDDSADGAGQAPAPQPQPAIIPTLSEWMLMLLGLLLPATVMTRLRRSEAPSRRR